MNRPISLVYRFSSDDAMRASKALANRSFLHRHDVLITGGGMFLLSVGAILLLSDEISLRQVVQAIPFSLTVALMAAVLAVLWHHVIGPVIAKHNIHKAVRASPILAEELLFRFSDEGVHVSSESSSSISKWSIYTRAVELESDFILYFGGAPTFLPKTAFSGEDELCEMRSLLAANLGPKAELL